MGNRNSGRRPMPTALKLYRGNPGKRPLDPDEVRPRMGRPECPDWLSAEAQAHWQALIPELDAMGVLAIVDRGALAGMCQEWANFRKASEWLNEHGTVYKTETNYLAQAPQVAIARNALETYIRIATEFGLTASSRARLAAPRKRANESLLTG